MHRRRSVGSTFSLSFFLFFFVSFITHMNIVMTVADTSSLNSAAAAITTTTTKVLTKRDLLIHGLFNDADDDDDDENMDSNDEANDDDDNDTRLNSTTTSNQQSTQLTARNLTERHFFPFRVKILNESAELADLLVPLSELLDPADDYFYLNDRTLAYEAPFQVDRFFECTVRYQRVWRAVTGESTDSSEDYLGFVTANYSRPTPIQVEIAGVGCDIALGLVLTRQLRWPANITQLTIRGTGIQWLDRFHFGSDADTKLVNLRRIDLVENRELRRLGHRTFGGLARLEVLRIFRCSRLDHVNRQALSGLRRLRQFVFAQNAQLSPELFGNLTGAAAKHLVPDLIQLYLESPTFDLTTTSSTTAAIKLTKDDLHQLRHLKSLHLVNLVNLRFVHPLTLALLDLTSLSLARNTQLSFSNLCRIFSTLARTAKHSKLTHLSLSGTFSSATLPRQLLHSVGKLPIKVLRLNSVHLKQIHAQDLPPMPNLEQLYLDHNPIELIEDHALDQLSSLRLLSLKGHRLRVIRSELLYNLPRLTHLDLSDFPENLNHSITALEIEPKTFVGLSLEFLDLSHRSLDPLPDKLFLGLHKVRELYLRDCGLRRIEYLTFFFLKSLRLLDLSHNPRLAETLRHTHDDSFFGAESVEAVRLANCGLVSADLDPETGIFARMHERVQELDLSGNYLTELHPNMFGQFSDLRAVNLSGNRIHAWRNESVFRGNLQLTQLDLSRNRLTAVSAAMMDDLYRMRNLSFGRNPLKCDCASELFHGAWLRSTMVDRAMVYLDSPDPLHSTTEYYCVEEIQKELQNDGPKISVGKFTGQCEKWLKSGRVFNGSELGFSAQQVPPALVLLFTITLALISLTILGVSFVYYSELNQIFTAYFIKGERFSSNDEDQENYEYDAFVSYNVADTEWIFNQLVPNLEQPLSSSQKSSQNHPSAAESSDRRVRLCVYDRDFIAGRPISECILESIRVSRRVILVVSTAFVRSPWCRYETDLAHHHNTLLNRSGGIDGLVLVKLGPLDPALEVPVQLEFLLKTRVYLEWDEAAPAEFWRKLRAALGLCDHQNQEPTLKKPLQEFNDSAVVKKSELKPRNGSTLKRVRDKLAALLFDDLFESDLRVSVPDHHSMMNSGEKSFDTKDEHTHAHRSSSQQSATKNADNKDIVAPRTKRKLLHEDAIVPETSASFGGHKSAVHCTQYLRTTTTTNNAIVNHEHRSIDVRL